jgi:Protein of unknown function (DUF3775)
MPDNKNRQPEGASPATEAPETRVPAPEPTRPETQRPELARNTTPDAEAPELTIPVDTVAWIILKAREYDMKEPTDIATDEEDGDNPLGVLEDRADDPTAAELRGWIEDLSDDEQAELVALMWLGRGDDEDAGTYPGLVEQARGSQQHGQGRGRRTAAYLLGTPRLGDYLEEALEKLGVDTANLEGSLR